VQRVAAALVAVLMVVVALYLRGEFIDDGDGGTGGNVRLLCTAELEAACTELADRSGVSVTVEPAGQTAESLASLPDSQRRDVDFDAWLAPAPWPQMVDVQRRVQGLAPVFATPSDPIARSPLVLVARADRVPVLEATPACNGTVDWKCIGAVPGRPWTELPGGQAAWGTVKPGPGDPTRSATALLVASQATSEFLDKTDYALADLESDQYLDWVSGIARAVPKLPPTAASPFAEMLQQLPTATYDVVGTTEAEAGPGIVGAAPDRRRALTLLYPEPVVTADVVLAAVISSANEGAAEGLADEGDLAGALAGSGWRVPGQPNVRGVRDTPALPRDSGLPADPGALVALQQTWSGVPR
jgi:hypothetical protein